MVAAEGQYRKNFRKNFSIKVQSPWEDQLMLHVMRILMQFANGWKWQDNSNVLQRYDDYLINEQSYENKIEDKNDEAQKLLIIPAKLVIEDIRSKKYDSEYYPCKGSMSEVDEALSTLYLRLFLQNLANGYIKQVTFDQAITQAIKSRSCLSPVLLGIRVDADHTFESRWLVDFLSHFGFSKPFKQCTLRHDNLTTTQLQGGFAQWLAYNVDRNVCALSGKGSLHAMGIVCLITSPSGKMPPQTSLLKRKKVQSFKEIIKNK